MREHHERMRRVGATLLAACALAALRALGPEALIAGVALLAALDVVWRVRRGARG
jgi:hypothetical protein